MLSQARIAARLPCQDLERARQWYEQKLGLHAAEERDGGLLYRLANGEFGLFTSSGAPSGTHTQMGFEVDDIDAVAAELRRRGVVFEADGIVEIDGNYPSKGRGERATWFRDSEGNLLGLGQPV